MFVLNKIVFVLNIIVALLLLGSYLSPYSNPQVWWPISFLGLAYVVLLGLNVVFALYWLIQAKLHVFISLGAIVLGFANTGKFAQLSGVSKGSSDSTFKTISFNIQNFDERHKGKNPYPSFFEFVAMEKPDVLCLQEFNPWVGMTETTSTFDELRKAFGKKFYYATRSPNTNNLIIVSRYKIIKHKGINFTDYKSTNGAMWADIVMGKDTVRVFNVHFQSFLLNKESLNGFNDKDRAIKNSKNIVKRLRNGFRNRVPQVDTVLQEIISSPYKVLLCGDFNDTPMSFTYGELTDLLQDAFVECGSGLGSTYSGPYPSFRIDYIMHHPKIRSFNYKRGETYGSDHRTIQAEIALH